MFSRKTYLALSLTTALVAASQPGIVQATDASFGSQIVDATEAGSSEQVLNLLERGINPNERGQFGTSALLRAANSGNLEIAKTLIKHGANPNVSDLGGATALHIAARKGHYTIAKLLIQNKAKVSLADKQGNTALILASIHGNEIIVKELIKNGADIEVTNGSGENALYYATEAQEGKIIDMLLSSGASADTVDEEGYSTTEIAQRKNDSLLVAKLDKYDSDHVMISMGSGFRSSSAKKEIAQKERSQGEQLIAQLTKNNAIDFAETEYLQNPNDPELQFFSTPTFGEESQLASAAPKKSWLSEMKNAFEDTGAFELAAVKNFNEGNKYSLVEMGSFKLRAFAEKRINELQMDNGAILKDTKLVVFERGAGDNKEFYVNGGVFETLGEAESLCQKLAAKGVRCNPVETALITNNQFSEFQSSGKSTFSSVPVENVEIAELKAPEPIKFPKALAVKKIEPKTEPIKAMPVIDLPKIAKVVNVEAPVLPKIAKIEAPTPSLKVAVPAIPEETISLTELAGMSDDAPIIKLPKTIAPTAKITPVAAETEIRSVDDLVDSIFAEQEAKEVAAVEKDVLALPELPTLEETEAVSSIKQQINALPKVEVAKVAKAPQPLKIKFVEPNKTVTQQSTKEIALLSEFNNSSPRKIVNKGSNKPTLLTARAEAPTPVRVVAKPEAAIAKVQAPKVDKFVVAKPVRVDDALNTRIAAQPEPAYTTTAPTVTYNDAYIPSPVQTFNRAEQRRTAKVEYFESANSAQGLYWKYRENGTLNESITVRATRDLFGKPHYAALIGEFQTAAQAQAFCNTVYQAEKLRCNVMDEIDYTISSSKYERTSDVKRHSNYRSKTSSRSRRR